MKKFFTLTLALMASFSLWGSVYKTYSLNDLTNTDLTYEVTGLSSNDQKLNKGERKVEVPCASASGTLYLSGTGANADRYASIYGSNGTTYDATRQIAMTSGYGSGISFTSADILTEGGKYYIVFSSINGGTSYDYKINAFKYTLSQACPADCDDPDEDLALSASPAIVYVGDKVTFSTTGGNGGSISLVGSNSETINFTDSSWTATLGEHTFTASQEKNGNICAQEDELVINVLAADAVEECTISGPTAAYKNNQVTYTATAENASDYRWKIDGAIQAGASTATFNYTPTVNGTYSIVCEARNTFNAEGVWIASDPISLTVTSLYGTLVSYVVDGGTAATDKTGALSTISTPKVSLTSGSSSKLTVGGVEYTGYKMDKGKYVGVTLSSGSFLAGDTVSFIITTKTGSAKLYLYDTESGTNRLDSIDGTNKTGWVSFVLNQSTTGVYLYRFNPDVKPYDQNPYVAAVKVTRPMPTKSTVVALTGVKIDDEAISASQLESLIADESLDIATSYVNAPEVKFYKQTTITYEDDSQKVIPDSTVVTAAENGAGKWEAQATIGTVDYTVTMAKTPSYTVTYKLGSRTLGSENVVSGGNPTNYEDYEDQGNYATFKNWCSDAGLESAVTIASAVIDKDTIFYGKFDFEYASSINIEQWILDNAADSTRTVALLSLLGARNYASGITYSKGNNELDSLNSTKSDSLRNYSYLGLKVKSAGKMINFRLTEGSIVRIKFGNVAAAPLVAINSTASADYEAMSLTDGVYEYTATGEDLVSVKTATAGAVVFKQIMIDEPLADVMYGISYGTASNGTISGWKIAKPGETVKVYPKPASGYKVASVSINDEPLAAVGGAYSFTMPSEAVSVSATFSVATALDNTADEAKAVKYFKNGQLFIEMNGKTYNAQGIEIR